LRKARLNANTIQVKIRRADFKTCTRQRGVKPPASSTDQIYAVARELLGTWLASNAGAKIRLLGIGGNNLVPSQQPDLFATINEQDNTVVDNMVDEIRDRFGTSSVTRARTLDRR
jgi:DNA polymerase-4